MATCRTCQKDGATHEVPEPTWVQAALAVPFLFGLIFFFTVFFGLLFVVQPLLLIEKALEFFSLGIPEGIQMVIGYSLLGALVPVSLIMPVATLAMMIRITIDRWKHGPNVLCDTCWEERETRIAAEEAERAHRNGSYEPYESPCINTLDDSQFSIGPGRF